MKTEIIHPSPTTWNPRPSRPKTAFNSAVPRSSVPAWLYRLAAQLRGYTKFLTDKNGF